jgi:endo-1,4-beta-xylanase
MKNRKKNYNKRFLIAHIICTMGMLSFIPVNTFAQLVTNGSFESSATGVVNSTDIDGWLIEVAGEVVPVPVFEIVDDTVQDGSRALKVSIDEVGANQWDIQVVSDSIPVTPGNTYNYSIWAKAEIASAQVNFTAGNYSFSEYGAIRPATLTTEWQEFTLQFTVTDDQTYIRAPIHLSYESDTMNVIYIDNLKIVDVNFGKSPIIVEAESGIAGSKFSVADDNDITYVTSDTNYTDLAVPGDTSRMITYEVTFPDSGAYNLFARMRVGSGGFNDDSFFSAKGFGVKDETLADDWVMVNGLAGAGFFDSADIVDELGTSGNDVWKWVNITNNFYPADYDTFFVSLDSLTNTFQFGSREDGLDFDKFAFGKAYLYYSVDDLDNGLPGSETREGPGPTMFYQGPPFAQGKEKFLGNAYGDVPDTVFANYWDQLTPGNAGKWGSVAFSQDTTLWNWNNLDNLYNYSRDNDLIFKNHTLIWGQQQPSWISELNSADQLKYIETWFRMVGQRYPDMEMIDVVNEPIASHNPPDGANGRADYKDALGGNGETGYDWVITSFELARKYLPNAQLLINDYGIINDNGATNTYLQIINLLNDRGLIDGIGVQGHRFEFEDADTTVLKNNLTKLGATGLPVYISELDLGNYDNAGTPDDDVQLQLYQKIFPVLWLHPAVKGITLWGYLEGQMWQTTCYLTHSNGEARPALDWLENYVKTTDFPTGTAVPEPLSDKSSGIHLEQNYPNPFGSYTTIKFSISESAKVSLKIYDMLGKEVTTLVNEDLPAGEYTITWNAENANGSKLENGTYFNRLVAGSEVITNYMLLIK